VYKNSYVDAFIPVYNTGSIGASLPPYYTTRVEAFTSVYNTYVDAFMSAYNTGSIASSLPP